MLPPRVYGLEAEYAVSYAGPRRPDKCWDAADCLYARLGEEFASIDDGFHSGFVANGGKFFTEAGVQFNYATPECFSPRQLVLYLKAGDRMVMRVAAAGDDEDPPVDVRTHGLDYLTGDSWGALHESYGHYGRFDILHRELVPHLVTRQLFCGAGGYSLSARPQFLLSPRIQMVQRTRSAEYTGAGGLFHTRDEPLAAIPGYHRVHVTCGDRPRSDLSLLLQVGTTALVLLAIEAGARPSHLLRIISPVAAARRVAADTEMQKPLRMAQGGAMTALQIQRRLRAIVGERLAAMPAWAGEIMDQWGWALEMLEGGPEAAAAFTDWGVKLLMMRQAVADLRFDNRAMRAATRDAKALDAAAIGKWRFGASTTGPEFVHALADLGSQAESRGTNWRDLRGVANIRGELCLRDLEHVRLYPGCLVDQLDEAEPRRLVPDLGDVAKAMVTPPPGGRAEVRGNFVREHAGNAAAIVRWESLWRRDTNQLAHLSDPMATEAVWQDCAAAGGWRRDRLYYIRPEGSSLPSRRGAGRRSRRATGGG